MTSAPSLMLWDIDRTLVDIGQVSREIYAKAFLDVTKQPLRDLADMTGRTEKAILVDTLALHGVSDLEAKCKPLTRSGSALSVWRPAAARPRSWLPHTLTPLCAI